VQNKFHYAITGQTAAEIVDKNADQNSPNMGLKTWKNASKGRILKSDTTIAKNYLKEVEIKQLERLYFFNYFIKIRVYFLSFVEIIILLHCFYICLFLRDAAKIIQHFKIIKT
jgi:hypothetical protein